MKTFITVIILLLGINAADAQVSWPMEVNMFAPNQYEQALAKSKVKKVNKWYHRPDKPPVLKKKFLSRVITYNRDHTERAQYDDSNLSDPQRVDILDENGNPIVFCGFRGKDTVNLHRTLIDDKDNIRFLIYTKIRITEGQLIHLDDWDITEIMMSESYNSDSTIWTWTQFAGNQPHGKLVYNLNADKNPTSAKFTFYAQSLAHDDKITEFEYTYNANGSLASVVKTYSGYYDDSVEEYFEFDDQGKLVHISKFKSGELFNDIVYSYNDSGLLESQISIINNVTSHHFYTYEYYD